MPSSTKFPPSRIRAALTLRKTSVPQIARKHRVNVKTCYAVLDGTRPGKCKRMQAAVEEMHRITREALKGSAAQHTQHHG